MKIPTLVPQNEDRVGGLFARARQHGAAAGTSDDLAGPSRSSVFQGQGRTLAGNTTQARVQRALASWRSTPSQHPVKRATLHAPIMIYHARHYMQQTGPHCLALSPPPVLLRDIMLPCSCDLGRGPTTLRAHARHQVLPQQRLHSG
jgi:hypothetical protein